MSMAEKVRFLLITKKMTQKELSEKLGTKQSNLSGKLKRDNFSESELQAIAQVCGVRFQGSFVFDDGKII